MLGIKGYKPNFLTNPSQFIRAHEKNLQDLIGKKIDAYYLQWETKDNEWNNDGPIILKIGTSQYEFTAFGLDEYSLTINKINLSEKLDWYGASETMPLIWKINPLDEINHCLNRKIETIHLLEYSMVSGVEENDERKKFFRTMTKSEFFVVGIEFKLSGIENHLQLSNGLDCNVMKIETEKVDIKSRKIKIA